MTDIYWPPKEYRVWEHNHSFHEACDKYDNVWFAGGVGSGKSVAGYIQDYWNAVGRFPGATGFLGLPNWGVYEEVVLPKLTQWWPEGCWINKRTQRGEKILVSAGGGRVSTIVVRVAMNRQTVDRWVGFDATWAHFEEPSAWKDGQRAWTMGLARMRGTAHAPVHITGTPGGFNWIAQAWGVKEELPPTAWSHGIETQPGYWIRCVKTSQNKANPPDFYERLVNAYGETYAKEQLRGAILAQEGRILRNFYPSVHMIPRAVAEDLFNKTTRRSGGVDWGWRNPGAVFYGGWDGDGNKIYPPGSIWYLANRQVEEQGKWAYDAQRKHGVKEYFCDPSRPEYVRKWQYGFEISGTRYIVNGTQPGISDWEPRMDALRSQLDVRGVGILDHPAHPPGNRLGRPGMLFSEDLEEWKAEAIAYRDEEAKPGELTPRERAVGADHLIDAAGYDVLDYQRRFVVPAVQAPGM